ncbi:MAG: hypothetical protein EA344_04710 [Alkalicoccus sp.]|nr:MAG: hypothetical protein EA344_04710 [Alkalicoccus sp.]
MPAEAFRGARLQLFLPKLSFFRKDLPTSLNPVGVPAFRFRKELEFPISRPLDSSRMKNRNSLLKLYTVTLRESG